MSHQVIWTRRVVQLFEQAANLTELQRGILETRVSGMTQLQQAYHFNLSLSTVQRIVNRLKCKYDAVQRQFPDDLKPRRNSASETYMDNH